MASNNLARINLENAELTYCNAGHPPALLLRENSEVEELRDGGPVLGALSAASFANGSERLCLGNTLLAYSDGIPECRNELNWSQRLAECSADIFRL